MWNEPYVQEETYLPLATQAVFNLRFYYRPGMNELDVFYNGILLSVGLDYQETNGYTVTFLKEATVGDTITFRKRNY